MASTAPPDWSGKDISNMPAYTILEDLLRQGKVSPQASEFLKAKYQKIHEVVIRTYSNEKALLQRAQQLNTALQDERLKLEQKVVVANDTQAELEVLQKEEKETGDHINQFTDQRTSIDFEIEELLKQEKENEVLLQEKYRADMAQMQPLINKLTTAIEDVKAEIKTNKEAWEKENEQSQEYQSKIAEATQVINQLEQTKLDKRAQFNAASAKPEQLKKQSSVMQNLAQARDSEVETMQTKINKLEATKAALNAQEADLKTMAAAFHDEAELLQKARHAREKTNAELRHKITYENNRGAAAEQERIHIDEQTKKLKEDLKVQLEAMASFHKACEGQKKWYERQKRKRDTVQSMLPPLISQYEEAQRKSENIIAQYKREKAMLLEIKQDEELFISQYLSQERLEEETAEMLYNIESDGKEYEEKINELAKDERLLQQQINTLSAQREVMARDASRATASQRELKEDLKVSNLILVDLHKQTQETFSTLHRVILQYEKMKNSRNKLANLTQSSSQSLAEMKEKIRILNNEVEILRNESLGRDRALAEEVRVHQAALNTRGSLRVDQNKHHVLLRQKQTEQNMQWMEIKKLNSIINGAEKQMIRLRTDYAQAVDNRNLTGIQLIDRNDELCILFEKANVQESILRKGDSALKEKEAEAASLKREIAEMRRKIDVGRKSIPSMSEYTEETRKLQSLEQQLEAERALTTRLCERLEQTDVGSSGSADGANATTGTGASGADSKNKENGGDGDDGSSTLPTTGSAFGTSVATKQRPDVNKNSGLPVIRCRSLRGVDPEPEQLAAKIEVLEERLNDKKEQLLEKELVLDEVTSMSDKLRNQAAESRGATLTLAQKVNDYQRRIRNATRKMMATVSELSMYQATAMKLEQQKLKQQAQLEAARRRANNNLPPTDDAEHEWYRMERDRVRRHEAMLRRARDDEQASLLSGGVGDGSGDGMNGGQGPHVRTSAPPRPNAYIPEELGIPKPYGQLAPFKPSVGGSTRRHFRNPVIKDIEI